MKIAYTGWTWLVNHQDNHRYEFEQFLKEVADLGYDAVENFAFITDYFDDAGQVRELLDKYGLEMVNLYQHFSDDAEADYKKAEFYVDFMKQIGATYLNLQGVMWNDDPAERPTDEATILAYADLCNRIGRLCRDNGCVACFHPHAQTPVYTQEQIDLLVANTDPELVGLCMDTAHTTIAGMDPVAAFAKFANRIVYVHLKDVTPDASLAPMARFRPLGVGTVDFPGVLRSLTCAGYDGVLCVELDKPLVCNYRSAQISREYIRNALGL